MELAKKLCEAYGPAGRETKICEMIQAEIESYARSIENDRLGNLIAFVPGTEKRNEPIMFCAHMDEIGLIVTHIDKNGYLRFTNVGGIFPEKILHQRVLFENGTVGVIGIETRSETPKPFRLDNLFIDIGAGSNEVAASKVRIGDIASFYQKSLLVNDHLITKALDDRIGCYCLIKTIQRIKNNKDDLSFVFSVQEEVGLRGAQTSAYTTSPKYAIAVDVTATGDTPECLRMEIAVGKGTAIKIKDRAFLTHPHIKNKLVEYAEKASIPYQFEVLEQGTTDAAVIQLVREGSISGVLSIPTRYVHSTNELCSKKDVEATIDLLTLVAEKGLSN